MKIVNKIFQLRSRQAFRLRSRKSGFSLLELITVIAIVGIMTTVGLVSLSASRTNKQLEVEARKVSASIRQAQNYALTGKAGAGGTSCKFEWRNFVNSGGGSIPDNDKSYWIRPFKKDAGGACVMETNDDILYSLQDGVLFPIASSFEFSVPFGSSSGSSVRVKKGSNCIDVSISSAGIVTEGQVFGC